MDVSWLHQVEAGDRSEQEDFLSVMFSDSIGTMPPMSPRSPPLSPRSPLFSPRSPLFPPSSPPMSPRSSVAPSSKSGDEAVTVSSDGPLPEGDRPHHSHFTKTKESSVSPPVDSSVSPDVTNPETSALIEHKTDGEPEKKTRKKPKLTVVVKPSAPVSQGKAYNVVQFSSKISDAIAHFIYESYFGNRSLSRRDMRHAALLGCSQIPDYVTLRDQESITFSPDMFDNLVSAVTKKFNAEVLPQFHNSIAFQIMVYALKITGFFEDQQHRDQTMNEKKDAEQIPLLNDNEMLKGMWAACVDPNSKEIDDESSDDSDSDSSDEDENNKDAKGGKNDQAEKKSVKAKSGKNDEDSSSSDGESSDNDKK